ncbi:FMN-binding negative transcriptional regulator [Neptuniibacter halophilus]|uniref:FMN-binding negative transcriptional regulator n=1 Tax=Neptuniibacter halophilus TaxID=651666 RepID=UPI00257392AC|nr:FMN-binding negative transcriptional regulator [Neptuniibacter halophilus]
MFIPKRFQQENTAELLALMQQYSFATLVTPTESGIEATHLPMLVESEGDQLYLRAHIAKANPIWKTVAAGAEVLAIFNGPDCYISPSHYPTKKEHGKAVPTWNYVVVHVKGVIKFIQDDQWKYGLVDRLTAQHEEGAAEPWAITDAPEAYIQKMLPAIIGLEIEVAEITGQWKLSQNQPEMNRQGVVDGLSVSPDDAARAIARLVDAQR